MDVAGADAAQALHEKHHAAAATRKLLHQLRSSLLIPGVLQLTHFELKSFNG